MSGNEHIVIKNIYYMLTYAFQALQHETYEDVEAEEFEDMQNLFAAILSRGIGLQIKRGLYREYRNQTEDIVGLRGKIDMPASMKHRLANRHMLACEYDELSENNRLNQILKTAVFLLLRHGKVRPAYKDELKKEMLFFSNVDTLDPCRIKWSDVHFNRNNQTYQMLIGISRLLIDGMLLTTEKGEYKLGRFVDDQKMFRLYEKFILEYYAQHYPSLSVHASQIPWALDDENGAFLPVMQSDISIRKGNTVLIIDAKFYSRSMQKLYDKATIRSNHLYQIFTYVKNREAAFGDEPHDVSGMLLYAKTDEEVQPDNDYLMSGNLISVKTLDLNRPFKEITGKMDSIVEKYFETAKSV